MTGGNDAGFVQEGLFEPSDRARTLFYYRAYGLRVSCEFRVHELEMVAAGPVDLEVSSPKFLKDASTSKMRPASNSPKMRCTSVGPASLAS